MKRLLTSVDKIFELIVVVTLALSIILMFIQILLRFFYEPLMWAEELSRIFFVWIVYMGAPIVIRRNANIEVDYFVQFFSQIVRRYLKITFYLIAFVFLLYVAWLGAVITIQYADKQAYTMPISQAIWYLPIAIGFLMMAINMARVVIGILRGTDDGGDLEKSAGVS